MIILEPQTFLTLFILPNTLSYYTTQSKAAAAAGFVPQQQVGFMAQPQAMYNPQQSAQAVAGAMPNYGG